jgi:hypothetical protein
MGAAESFFYRCPGCGEMVDGRNDASFRMHHYHMIRSLVAPLARPAKRRGIEHRHKSLSQPARD